MTTDAYEGDQAGAASAGARREDALFVVIMAGGAGTRFWPLSTAQRPKQFLPLLSERSLLQESHDRARQLVPAERILVLTALSFVDEARRQLPDLPWDNVIGEPERRDTAAAVVLAALLLRRRYGEGVMVVLTADHRISPVRLFLRAVLAAAESARRDGALYTFGIPPRHAATGYGYLEVGEAAAALAAAEDPEDEGGREPSRLHLPVLAFREKPDAASAREFVQSGRFLWNSGMFVWLLSSILEAAERFLPTHVELLAQAAAAEDHQARSERLADAFSRLPAVSIDRGIMERADRVVTSVAPFSWSDVGGWQALEEFLPEDARGNRHRGQLATLDAAGNLVFNEDPEELVALVGVRDLVVVRAGRRTLIVERSRCEEVKQLVESLERGEQGRHA
jgi:mannose-1-phosphate guanylyltransferase